MARNLDTCFAHLSRLIHYAPMLAAHVIRVANCPACAARVRITTLRQVVTRIGMRMLSELAITVGISEAFRVPGFEQEAGDIWRRALASATYAREIARSCRAHQEAAFLCGLLHTLGQPVVLRTVVKTAEILGIEIVPDAMRGFIETWEGSVGERLGVSWELPEPVRMAIARYRDFTGVDDFQELVAVTTLASELAAALPGECDPSGVRIHPAVAALRLSPEMVDDLLERTEIAMGTVKAMAA